MSDEPVDAALVRRLMAERGLQILTDRGFTPSHVRHMHSTWFDADGIKLTTGGVGPIELDRIVTDDTTAVLVFRPEDMTIGCDLRDHK